MQSPRYQKGMTIWQLAYVIGSLAVFGAIAVKCIPVYSEQLKIERAVKACAAAGNADPFSVRHDLNRRWDIESINVIDYKDVKVMRDQRGVVLTYDYDAGVPVFGNARLVFHFSGNELVNVANQ